MKAIVASTDDMGRRELAKLHQDVCVAEMESIDKEFIMRAIDIRKAVLDKTNDAVVVHGDIDDF